MLRVLWWVLRKLRWDSPPEIRQTLRNERGQSPGRTHTGLAVADLEARLLQDPRDFEARNHLLKHFVKFDAAKLRQLTLKSCEVDPGHTSIVCANESQFDNDEVYCREVLSLLSKAVLERNEPDIHINIAKLSRLMGTSRTRFELVPALIEKAELHFQKALDLVPSDDVFHQIVYREEYARFCEIMGALYRTYLSWKRRHSYRIPCPSLSVIGWCRHTLTWGESSARKGNIPNHASGCLS